MNTFDIVVAHDLDKGIGIYQGLPWQLKSDLEHFRNLTRTPSGQHKQNAVIIGRKTWESLPSAFRPLPQRFNAILSRSYHIFKPNCRTFTSFTEAVETLSNSNSIEHIFVIGGAQLYDAALEHSGCRKIFVTQIAHKFNCDTFFSKNYNYLKNFKLIEESATCKEGDLSFCFQTYQKNELAPKLKKIPI